MNIFVKSLLVVGILAFGSYGTYKSIDIYGLNKTDKEIMPKPAPLNSNNAADDTSKSNTKGTTVSYAGELIEIPSDTGKDQSVSNKENEVSSPDNSPGGVSTKEKESDSEDSINTTQNKSKSQLNVQGRDDVSKADISTESKVNLPTALDTGESSIGKFQQKPENTDDSLPNENKDKGTTIDTEVAPSSLPTSKNPPASAKLSLTTSGTEVHSPELGSSDNVINN